MDGWPVVCIKIVVGKLGAEAVRGLELRAVGTFFRSSGVKVIIFSRVFGYRAIVVHHILS